MRDDRQDAARSGSDDFAVPVTSVQSTQTTAQALREFCGSEKKFRNVVQSARSTQPARTGAEARIESLGPDAPAFPTRYAITRRASQPAEPCTALMGKDDLRAMRMDYDWWRQR